MHAVHLSNVVVRLGNLCVIGAHGTNARHERLFVVLKRLVVLSLRVEHSAHVVERLGYVEIRCVSHTRTGHERARGLPQIQLRLHPIPSHAKSASLQGGKKMLVGAVAACSGAECGRWPGPQASSQSLSSPLRQPRLLVREAPPKDSSAQQHTAAVPPGALPAPPEHGRSALGRAPCPPVTCARPRHQSDASSEAAPRTRDRGDLHLRKVRRCHV